MENDLLNFIRQDKDAAYEFQERKHDHWDENYFLYRDKVKTNRLTQRQAINLPIMKETVRTYISKLDEDPVLTFECKSREVEEKRKEIVINELWSYTYIDNKLDILDNIEKKVVALQGRGIKKLVWIDGKFKVFLIDPYDFLVDPKVNPLDLESADYVIHKNIFRPLRKILANKDYLTEGKNKLKTHLDSKHGLLKVKDTQETYDKRNERLRTLGVNDFESFASSDVIVEINEVYKMIWNEKEKKFVRHLIVIAADEAVLLNKPLKEAVGMDELPFVTWSDDVDINDFWNDSIGDTVRTPNKIMNIWMSQLLENRTYRNFSMFFFDSTNKDFSPGSFEARPFGMYPIPGNPQEVMQQVQIPALTDSINEMNYVKGIIESATATTSYDKGVQPNRQETLGQAQLNLQESKRITATTAKNYQGAWEELGRKFYKMMEQNASGKLKLYKKGNDGQYYDKEVSPSDWKTQNGYEVTAVLKSKKDADNQMALQKTTFVRAQFPDNPAVQKIAKRKLLEILEWNQDEIQEAIAAEDQKGQQMQGQMPGMPPGTPPEQGIPSNLQALMPQ